MPSFDEKFGTHVEVIDPSKKCVCVNVIPDISNGLLPVCFRLQDDSLEGYLISDVDITNNVGEIDYYKVYTSNLSNNANCIVYVKAYNADDSTYYYSHVVKNGGETIEYKIENRIEELLKQGVRKLTFKIVLRRNYCYFLWILHLKQKLKKKHRKHVIWMHLLLLIFC